MKRKVLKEIRSLYPPENLIDITDEYWEGYKDAVMDAERLIKKLHLHSVSNFVARCERCKCKLTLVRPGKYQCDNPDCSGNDC